MEHTPLAVIEWGADSRIVRWSGAAERIFGWTAGEVLGKRIEDFKFVYDEDLDRVRRAAAVLDSGRHFQTVSRNRNYRKDGSVIHCEWYNSSIVDASGHAVSTLSLVLDTTEKHSAEAELRQRAEELEKLLEVVPAVVLVAHDPECRIITGNARANELLKGAVGENLSPLSRPELRRRYIQNGRELRPEEMPVQMAAGSNIEVRDFEIDVELEGGKRRTIFGSAAPLRNETGESRGSVAAFIEITSRKKGEDELKSSEAQFRMLANALPQMCWMADRDGYIFWYNERWYEYTGTTPEQMKGWGWQSVHDPNILPKVLDRWKASLASGKPFEMVFPLRGKDGNFRQFLTRCWPIADKTGQVSRWLGTNTDVHEERETQERLQRALDEAKNAERQIQESEARFRAFLNASSDVVFRMSPDWKEMRQLDGRGFIANTEVPSRHWIDDYIFQEDHRKVRAAIEQAIASKTMFQLEHRVRRVDGSIGWTFSRAVPIVDSSGNIIEWFGTATDVTARKQAEQALIHSEKIASVGRLAATISHEINNPLEAVTNLLYLVHRDPAMPPHLREYVKSAEDELARAAHMAKRTLSFVRIETKPRVFRVADLVQDVLRMLATMLKSRGVQVNTRFDERAQAIGLAIEIKQVCINLISNAVDAGAKAIEVRVSQRTDWRDQTRRAVRITIADTGSGMAKEVQSRIFDPFFTTKSETGTGLGLWVSHEIVRKAGGNIRVRSTPGKGTAFSVYLRTGS